MKKILMVLTILSVLVCCGAASASDPAASVVISPQNPEMGVGESITVTAQGYDNNGNPVQIQDPNWEWDPQYGTLTVDANNPCQASFQATAPGDGYALCYEGPPYQGGPSGSTDIKITASQLAQIIVTPATVTMLVGEQQQFTATGKDKNGNTYQITPIWSTNGGTINQNGQYTATVPGDFTVTASVSGSTITGTGSVHTDQAPYLEKIEVSPSSVSMFTGQQQMFQATGKDQYGNTYQITPIWSTNGGTTDQNGKYTATIPGDFTVTASVSGSTVTGTGNVQVNQAPSLARIEVTPSYTNLDTGQKLQFNAKGYDQYGNEYPINPVWTTNGGDIKSDGYSTATYTATVPGDFLVTAHVYGSTVTGTSGVHVREAPYLVRLVINPTQVKLYPAENQQFSATGYDQYGDEFPCQKIWDTTLGAIYQDGYYVNYDEGGKGLVTVSSPGSSVKATATVEVLDPPKLTQLFISPTRAIIPIRQSITFTATGYDQYGNSMPVDPTYTYCWGKFTVWLIYESGNIEPKFPNEEDMIDEKNPLPYNRLVGYQQAIYVVTAFYQGVISNNAIIIVYDPSLSPEFQSGLNPATSGMIVSDTVSNGDSASDGATTTNTNTSPNNSNDTSPLVYVAGVLVVGLVALGIYKLR